MGVTDDIASGVNLWHDSCRTPERMAEKFRLAAMADLHCKTSSAGVFKDMFAVLAEDVNALALCGDLVDYGLPAEAEILLDELSPVLKKNIPILAVFGNHEF